MVRRIRVNPDDMKRFKQARGRAVDLFIDCRGDDSAFVFPNYIDFIQRNYRYLWAYTVPRQRVADIYTSVLQLNRMHDAGLSPIPVFQQGLPLHWLDRMLSDGERYIGFEPIGDLNEQTRWLDMVFSLLTDGKGRPLVKAHGFKLKDVSLLLRYPFYSADVETLPRGFAFAPLRVADEIKPRAVHVKDPAKAREMILKFYLRLEDELEGVRYGGPRVSMSGKDHFSYRTLEQVSLAGVNVFFETGRFNTWGPLLRRMGVRNRILPYRVVQKIGSDAMQNFVLKDVGLYEPRQRVGGTRNE